MAKQTPQELQQEITDKIIAAIEGGITEDGKWERPWTVSHTFPINPTTGKTYNGMNAILLMILGGGNFAGYGQWDKTFKAQVRKGEKSIPVLAPMMRKTGNKLSSGKDEMIPVGFRTVRIFSADQVEGWDAPVIEPNHGFIEHEAAEQAIAYMVSQGVTIEHGGDRAFFRPSADMIAMPAKEQFPDESDYYATMLHEMVHWTGKSDRLNRIKATGGRFGSHTYAFEELVAELGASILCGELGVHNGYRDNHAKYIANWLTIMKGDSKAIMDAASMAGKAVDVIMGRRTIKGQIITAKDETNAAA
jgi:antirestriction protein ArdC